MSKEKKNATDMFNSDFCVRFRDLLKKHNITHHQLSKITGITRQSITDYANGDVRPNIDALKKIADHFEVSADYLIGCTNDPTIDDDLRVVFESLKISSFSVEELREFDNIELLIVNDLIEHKYLKNFCIKMKDILIEQVMFSLVNNYEDFEVEGFGNDMYEKMRKWDLNKHISKMFDDFISTLLRSIGIF